MRYIRTKDGKLKIEYRRFTTHNGKVLIDTADEDFFYEESQILKEADTIEELCDGLIVEQKDNEDKWFTMSVNEFKNMDLEEKQYMVKDWSYKAFIKTDKGLIYVAKMNNEGVLCLL